MDSHARTPSGWYQNPDDDATLRYWDGAQWTDHTAPIGGASKPRPGLIPPPAPKATTAPPPPPNAAQRVTTGAVNLPPGESATATATKKKSTKVGWIIGGVVVVGILLLAQISAATRGNDSGATEPSPTTTVAAAAPDPSESTTAPPAQSDSAASDADVAAFRTEANGHLDDMLKDLDDLVTTVEEEGFWRLFSNYGELQFNLGQLEALDPPASVAETWPEALTALDGSLDVLSDAISDQDGPSILIAIDTVRAQVEAARAVADSAE